MMPGMMSKTSSSHLNPQVLIGSRHPRKDTAVWSSAPLMGNSTLKTGLQACPIMDLSYICIFIDDGTASWYMVQGTAL